MKISKTKFDSRITSITNRYNDLKPESFNVTGMNDDWICMEMIFNENYAKDYYCFLLPAGKNQKIFYRFNNQSLVGFIWDPLELFLYTYVGYRWFLKAHPRGIQSVSPSSVDMYSYIVGTYNSVAHTNKPLE